MSQRDLLDLLPVHLRVRDEESGGLLRALLEVVGGELDLLDRDLDQLYASWFVETCPEWVVPYLADLVGAADLPAEAPGSLSRRAFVANTIGYRRRKGTVAVIEQVARDASGWPAKAVEFYSRLSASGHVNHVRTDRTGTASLRRPDRLDLVPPAVAFGALDPLPHTGEARHIDSGRGRYQIGHLGVFVFGTQIYQFSSARPQDWPEAVPVPAGFAAHPLGHPMPLFAPPATEQAIEHLADEADLPVPLRPRRLLRLLAQARSDPARPLPIAVEVDGEVLPAERIRVSGLERWSDVGGRQMMVDPVTATLTPKEPPTGQVRVRHSYGAVADVGAGPYDRAPVHDQVLAGQGFVGDGDPVRPDVRAQVSVAGGAGLAAALAAAEAAWAAPADSPAGGTYVVSIADSSRFVGDLSVTVPAATRLVIVAATRRDREVGRGQLQVRVPGPYAPEGIRPVIDGKLTIRAADGAAVLLDGLVLTGDLVVQAGDLGWLTVSQCTLAGELRVNGSGATANENCRLALVRTLAQRVRLADAVPVLGIVDSVLDPPNSAPAMRRTARAAAGARAVIGAAAAVSVAGSTLLGSVECRSLQADNAIFDGTVTVEHRQIGCVRYSYLGPGSRTPRRFACVSGDGAAAPAPVYVSTERGAPSYLALAAGCPSEIAAGGEGESEMGVHNWLARPARLRATRRLLEPFVPVGLEIGMFGS